VTAKGDVYAFAAAPFYGSMGGQALAKPVVAIATTPGGNWEVGSDGGVFCFGTAPFEGSLGSARIRLGGAGMGGHWAERPLQPRCSRTLWSC
jgi:hypothetical protein